MRGHLRRLLLALAVLSALVFLAYQLRHRFDLADFTWSKFKFAVGQANPWLILLAVVAIYGCYAVRSLRWQHFSRHFGHSSFLGIYNATLMGFAAIFLLGRPGEPVRPLLLARKSRLPVSSMFGIWVLERIFDFAAAVGMAILCLLVFSAKLSEAGVNEGWVRRAQAGGLLLLGALLTIVLLMVYFRMHGAGVLDRRLENWYTAGGWKGWTATGVTGFSQGLQAIRTISDLALASIYTVAHWGLVALAYLWVSQAFEGAFPHAAMNLTGAMLLLAVTLVGSALQLPGVGGGAQVASFIALTTIFRLEQEHAVALAVMLWLVAFASSSLVGVPLLIHEGLSVGELRKLARAEAEAEKFGKHLSLTGAGWRVPVERNEQGGTPP